MNWEEQKIRDQVAKLYPSLLNIEQAKLLLDEIDKARAVLQLVKDEATVHMEERLRGWERWQKVYDHVKAVL